VKDNPWVITGTMPGAPVYDLQPFWQRVRARAGLNVRIHDLRHFRFDRRCCRTRLLSMIGKLLGHTQVQTTARYAHLAGEPIRVAANQGGYDIGRRPYAEMMTSGCSTKRHNSLRKPTCTLTAQRCGILGWWSGIKAANCTCLVPVEKFFFVHGGV
jgi:hypothetical protein